MSTVTDPVAAVAALGDPTRRRLYEFVVASGRSVGRDEAATELGIGRPLAAFHLDRLVRDGLLSTEYRRLTGRTGRGAGRPAKLYRRSTDEIEVSLPERRYAFAAKLMVGAMTGRRGASTRRALLEAGREAGRSAAAGSRSMADAGFEPAVQDDGTVVLRNCPYAALVPEHRDVVCSMNLAYAEGFLEGGDAALEARLEPAEGRCCVLLVPTTP